MWLKHKPIDRTIFTFMHVKITPHLNQTNSIDAWLSMRFWMLLLLLLLACFCIQSFCDCLLTYLSLSVWWRKPPFISRDIFYIPTENTTALHSEMCASNKVKTIYTADKIMFIICLVCACCCKSFYFKHTLQLWLFHVAFGTIDSVWWK